MPSKPLKTFIRHLFESDSEFRAFLPAPAAFLTVPLDKIWPVPE